MEGIHPAIPGRLTDFAQAMQQVSLACQILQHVDWEGLYAVMSDRDGMLAFRDPTLFMRVHADPQWGAKLGLVKAAANFTHAVRAIKTDLAEGE
ncbi:MAG: hypothetical protein QM699_01520 [Amaricoccus sp.]|uniref:hypothetical protein n=1 Tax=Amaricoccus sp. TaxID=1872485 RepID=UPI0039E4A309